MDKGQNPYSLLFYYSGYSGAPECSPTGVNFPAFASKHGKFSPTDVTTSDQATSTSPKRRGFALDKMMLPLSYGPDMSETQL